MSKKQAAQAVDAAPAVPQTVEVRALVDSAPHGLRAGALAVIAAELLPSLKSAGYIDDHPDAIACAKAQ